MSVPVPNYQEHQDYINTILNSDIKDLQFKNKIEYTKVLENLSRDKGAEYLRAIEEDFPTVTFEDIRTYINLNDKYGGAIKTIFTMSNMRLLYCSPTTLRYIYHALLILKYYQETNCKHIVELGQGYGGLFLAINFFLRKHQSTATNPIIINSYTMIDLPDSCDLTIKYLQAHQDNLIIDWNVCDHQEISWETVNTTKTPDEPNDTFFISNYCFTAIDQEERTRYADMIIKPCTHGLLTWQTCFGADINQADQILRHTVIKKEEETPQTAQPHIKNYYVYF
jgi:hypothetical protein